MFKIILVDDEPLVKVALKSLIDWEAHGYHICATASNGQEALEFIHEYQPHIILTDLKMPVLDGLDLIRKLKQENYPGKVLVLSNYSDYDNVREALKLGAEDYLLKINLQPEELLKQLKVCTEKLSFTGTSSDQPLLHPLIWKEYYYHNTVSETTKQYLYSFVNFYILYLQWKNISERRDEAAISALHIQNILPEISSCLQTEDLIILEDSALLIILPKENLEEKHMKLKNLCTRIHQYLERFFQLDVFLVYSPLIADYSKASDFFFMLKQKLHYLFYQPSCCLAADAIHLQHYLNYLNYRGFSELLLEDYKNRQPDNANNKLYGFLTHCSQSAVEPELVKKYLCKVFDYLEIFLADGQITDIHELETKLSCCTSFQELPDIWNTFSETLYSLIQNQTTIYRKETVSCLNYLKKNLTKKLSLADISAYVSLNEKYLCRIFKEDTGISIIQYLNQLKMEYAAEQLKNPNALIKEVADSVGIADQFYFNRLFKKYFGVAPSAYQKNTAFKN